MERVLNIKMKANDFKPYTPGVEKDSFARIRRIISAPKEFALRNVFYDEKTLKPI